MNSVAEAHAKLILLGEHFVVPWKDGHGNEYPGSSALALPLPELMTQVRIEPSTTGRLVCEAMLDESYSQLTADRVAALMKEAAHAAASYVGWDLERYPLQLRSSSAFPISRGLGSSAAFSVALVRAFVALLPEVIRTETELLEICQRIENLFHGKSSGLDTAVILRDEPILFRNGEVLGSFRPASVDLIAVDSGPRDECSALVSQTLELRKNQPEIWRDYSEQIELLVTRCLDAMKESRGADEVAHVIREAHRILTAVGLVTPNVQNVLNLGQKLGALAGKVSGAGAGGAVLFVTRPGEGEALAGRLESAGVPVLSRIRSRVVEGAYAEP